MTDRASSAGYDLTRFPHYAGGPTALDMREDAPERTEDNACPECETGVVIEVGRQCRETGHTPIACSDRCGWTS